MPRSEQLSQTPLFANKANALTHKVHALLPNNKTKKLVTGFVFFMESRPLWQKIVTALVLFLAPLITGAVLQIRGLIIASSCALFFSSLMISLFEAYKKQHEQEHKVGEQQVDSLNEELGLISEELSVFSKELGYYQALAHDDKTATQQKVRVLTSEKKQLESSLTNLSSRNKVLTEIKNSLMGENHALHTVVAEKTRLLLQKEQRISELERLLAVSVEEKKTLIVELAKYEQLKASLIKDKQQLHGQVAVLEGQQRALVEQIKAKDAEIADLTLSKQHLEQELANSGLEQERLKLVISDLQQKKEHLKLRIKSLNLKLFGGFLNQEKNQQQLVKLLTAGEVLQKNNEWLTLKLTKLGEEHELLLHTVEALRGVEHDLTNAKSKMAELIMGLEQQLVEQSKLLDLRKEQLEAALTDYQTTKVKLDIAVSELDTVKQGINTEVDRVKQTQIKLTKLVVSLSQSALKREEDSDEFLTQLQGVLQEKESSFQQVAAHALAINQRLTAMSQDFEECLARHKRLVQIQEEYIQQKVQAAIGFFAPSEPALVVESGHYSPTIVCVH